MKMQKLNFVRNTAPDNLRVLNVMRNPDWRIFLVHFLVVMCKWSCDIYMILTSFLRKRRILALWKLRNGLRWIKDGKAFKMEKLRNLKPHKKLDSL